MNEAIQVDFEHEENTEKQVVLSASHKLYHVPRTGDFVTFNKIVYRVTDVLWDFGPRNYPIAVVMLITFSS